MKKQKNYQSGSAPIYLRITVEGKRAEIATGRQCDPQRWNSKSGGATGTKEDVKALMLSLILTNPEYMKPIVYYA